MFIHVNRRRRVVKWEQVISQSHATLASQRHGVRKKMGEHKRHNACISTWRPRSHCFILFGEPGTSALTLKPARIISSQVLIQLWLCRSTLVNELCIHLDGEVWLCTSLGGLDLMNVPGNEAGHESWVSSSSFVTGNSNKHKIRDRQRRSLFLHYHRILHHLQVHT